jgi:hypothetical protein
MRREHLVQTKVLFLVLELCDCGRQIDRLAITDSRLLRNIRKRRDLDGLARQPLDIDPKNILYVFQMKAGTRVLQNSVRLTRLKCEIAATRFR